MTVIIPFLLFIFYVALESLYQSSHKLVTGIEIEQGVYVKTPRIEETALREKADWKSYH